MNQNIKILYVEDEDQIRENTKRPLSYLSSELILAKNGIDGLRLFKEHQPDIVITDIKMPLMNGIDMVKEIKKINNEQHIIFTTAHSESGFFIEAIELQVDGYILKPIDYDLLESKLESVINQIILKKKFQIQEVINQEITKFQDNLLAIFDKDKDIIFLNENFLDFFQIKNNEEFKKKYGTLYSLFIDHEENTLFDINTKDWIENLHKIEKTKRIVTLKDMKKLVEKSFLVSIRYVDSTSHTLITFTEITSIAIERDEFEHKAFTDELTKVYNRAYFNEKLKEEICIAKKANKPLSFFIFDIDLFKKMNDTYGHQIGDEILVELSEMVTLDTRSTDTFVRWGGEEFIKLLPNTVLKNAINVAEKLRKKIEEFTFVNDLKITCSFGVAQFNEDDSEESFIKKADDALYLAKENGRNLVASLDLKNKEF